MFPTPTAERCRALPLGWVRVDQSRLIATEQQQSTTTPQPLLSQPNQLSSTGVVLRPPLLDDGRPAAGRHTADVKEEIG